jgi:hypothetical protein
MKRGLASGRPIPGRLGLFAVTPLAKVEMAIEKAVYESI